MSESVDLFSSNHDTLNSLFAKRAYVCINKADVAIYKSRLLKELSVNNYMKRILFWSAKPGVDSREDEFEKHLNEISHYDVIIVAVTSTFLANKDDIAYKEFMYLKDRHKHILPLVLEEQSGLASAFGMISGKMHVLKPFSEESSAIPFRQKLVFWMDMAIGFDQALTKKIDSVFTCHTFISYRKMDRQYVNTVLEAIHSSKEMDRIAVWYDEFEEAGSDYSKQIWDAFGCSAAGILLVTKNTCAKNEKGDDNFVVTKEYPFICKHKIPLIPVICDADVDIAAVSDYLQSKAEALGEESYPLSTPVYIEDSKKIAELLESYLLSQDVVLSKQFENAYGLYYMGLAYQLGHLVEQSPIKAINYFMSAAKYGCQDAYERLIYIYEEGIGVPANPIRAREILEGYVDFLFNHSDLSDKITQNNAFCALSHLIEIYHKRKLKDEVYAATMLVNFTNDMEKGIDGKYWIGKHNMAEVKLARAYANSHDYWEAYDRYTKILPHYKRLVSEYNQNQVVTEGAVASFAAKYAYEPYIMCLTGIGKCILEGELCSDYIAIGLGYLERALQTKKSLVFNDDVWAIMTIYENYHELIRQLIQYSKIEGFLDLARKYADEDYSHLMRLDEIGEAKTAHQFAWIINVLLTGDIEKIRNPNNPDKADEYYRSALLTYIDLLKKGYYNDEVYEELNLRGWGFDFN